MTKQELIKELELLADSCDSNYALEVNGYNRGVLDALDVVNKYFDLAPVISSLPDANPHICAECSWQCACSDQPCSCCSGNDL
jgi:hypothetical protein